MTYDNWKTRSPDDEAHRFTKWAGEFQCDRCEEIFSDEEPVEVDGPGGWTMCAACAERHNDPDSPANDPMRGVEFPFAENH